jgi:hypothetical protein
MAKFPRTRVAGVCTANDLSMRLVIAILVLLCSPRFDPLALLIMI